MLRGGVLRPFVSLVLKERVWLEAGRMCWLLGVGGKEDLKAGLASKTLPCGLVSSPKAHNVSSLWWQEQPCPGPWQSQAHFRMWVVFPLHFLLTVFWRPSGKAPSKWHHVTSYLILSSRVNTSGPMSLTGHPRLGHCVEKRRYMAGVSWKAGPS